MRKLFNLKMNENTHVTQHMNLFSDTVNQLDTVVIKFDNEVKASICDQVLAEEVRRRDTGESFLDDTALSIYSRGRNKERWNNRSRLQSRGKRGHS